MDNVGELLIKMFMLCKEHDVGIRISAADTNEFGPSAFKIQLDRGQHHISKVVDVTRTYREPAEMLDCVFHSTLYDLDYYISKEENK